MVYLHQQINPLKWEVEQLKKLCHFENGDRGKNYPSKDSFVDEGIPFVNAGNLTDGIIDENYLNYITNEKYEKLSSGKIQKGDILFCLRGSLGKFALNNKLTKGAIASSLVIIRPSEKVNVEFLVHFFKSKYCKKLIKESDNGSAQPNLSAASVKSFQLPLPPIDLQEKLKAKYKESEKELNNLFGSLMQRAFKGELT